MKPTLSQTILLPNMYQSPDYAASTGQGPRLGEREVQEHFEDFYEDVFEEMAKHGEVEGLNVCDNHADHLVGNVYVKFREEEAALAALNAVQGRYYQGRVISCEFSPVTDFRESTCRQYEEKSCGRAGYCNFMHLKPIGRELRKQLFGRYPRRDDRDARRDDRGRGGYDRGRRGGGGYYGGYGGDDRRGGRRRGDEFDDRYRRGGGGRDDGRFHPYGGDRSSRDADRYDDRRDRGSRGRSRSRSRSPSRERGGGARGAGAYGMSDDERRAMFAKWNQESKEGGKEGGERA